MEALKNDILTFGKIRGSYAEVGMAGEYVPPSIIIRQVMVVVSSREHLLCIRLMEMLAYIPYFVVYDPNLKPQNTKSYELGADLTFLEWFLVSLNYTYSSERERPNLRGAFGWFHRCFQYDDEWWKDALKRT